MSSSDTTDTLSRQSNDRPVSTVARSFSAVLDSAFSLDPQLENLSQSVAQKQQSLSTQRSELQDLELRLRETEARLRNRRPGLPKHTSSSSHSPQSRPGSGRAVTDGNKPGSRGSVHDGSRDPALRRQGLSSHPASPVLRAATPDRSKTTTPPPPSSTSTLPYRDHKDDRSPYRSENVPPTPPLKPSAGNSRTFIRQSSASTVRSHLREGQAVMAGNDY